MEEEINRFVCVALAAMQMIYHTVVVEKVDSNYQSQIPHHLLS